MLLVRMMFICNMRAFIYERMEVYITVPMHIIEHIRVSAVYKVGLLAAISNIPLLKANVSWF